MATFPASREPPSPPDGQPSLPAIVLNTAADTASSTLFLADLVRTISRTPIFRPSALSASSRSTIRLSSSRTTLAPSSPSACVSASARSASSARPWRASQRGDSGTEGQHEDAQSRLKAPWTSEGARQAQVLG